MEGGLRKPLVLGLPRVPLYVHYHEHHHHHLDYNYNYDLLRTVLQKGV